MSNIRAITGSTKIMNRPTHGGSKKQGIPSSTNLNTWSHVAFRNRNVVCSCNRHVVFCMNQLGGVGAGGIPGGSYMFASTADGVNKNKILCGINHKNIRHPSQFELIYPPYGGTSENNPLQISFSNFNNNNKYYAIDFWKKKNNSDDAYYPFITSCYKSGSGNGTDVNCYNKQVVGNIYAITFMSNGKTYNVTFLITGYAANGQYLTVKFLNNPSRYLLNILLSYNHPLNIIKAYKSTYKVNV